MKKSTSSIANSASGIDLSRFQESLKKVTQEYWLKSMELLPAKKKESGLKTKPTRKK